MRSFLQLIAAYLLMMGPVIPVFAQSEIPQIGPDYIVNVTTDSADGLCSTTHCSLREAITAANVETYSIQSVLLPAGIYTLSIPGRGENNNATGDLDLRANVELVGAGRDQTIINAAGIDRVIDIALPRDNLFPRAEPEHRNLTFENGQPEAGANGGGIRTSYGFTLFDGIIRNNQTTGNGGGFYGNVYLHGVIIRGNQAANGGGGYNFDWYAIYESIIENNTATVDGGGLANLLGSGLIWGSLIHGNSAAGNGGGIALGNTFIIDFSTISQNQADGDGGGLWLSAQSNVDISISTIAFNQADADDNGTGDGGGVFRALVQEATSDGFFGTIVAGNSDTGAQAPDCGGSFVSQGYNFIQDIAGCTVGGISTGNLTGLDPLLAPLADYGGRAPLHALLPGSPARDVIPSAACQTAIRPEDQRGVARPQGPACDIGAYEAFIANPLPRPTNGSITNVNRSTLTLNWQDHSADETGFEVQRRLFYQNPWEPLPQLPPNTTSFMDSIPIPFNCLWEETYTYRIRAVRSDTGQFSDWFYFGYVFPPPCTDTDLVVSLNDSPDPVEVNQTLSLNFYLTNSGTEIADRVAINLQAPSGPGLTFINAVSNLGGTPGVCVTGIFNDLWSGVNCTLGPLEPGGVVTIRVDVRPQSTGTVSVQGQVSATVFDPTPANNTQTTSTTVINEPTPTITPSVTPTPDFRQSPGRNTFIGTSVRLTWVGVSIATGYEIEIATNPAFTGAQRYVINGGTTLELTASLSPGNYYWRGRALFGSNSPGRWSEIETFTLRLTP
jgi:CSLREA domain-containing protein